MPFVPHTPESDFALTDPSRGSFVCRGISNEGKPCKKVLQRGPNGEPASGIITIVNKREAFFCARHQEQAHDVVLRHTASFARRRQLVGRGSMDTLIEQVELLVSGQNPGSPTTITTHVSTTKKVPKNKDPFAAQAGDDSSSASDVGAGKIPKPPSPPTSQQRPTRQSARKKDEKSLANRFFHSLCCIAEQDEDDGGVSLGEKKTEAELRAAAAGVVDPTQPKTPLRGRKQKPDSHVAFETVPPTPPLPLMNPGRKEPQSAMLKYGPVPTAAGASKVTAGKGATPTTPVEAEADDDDDVPGIDFSKLSKEEQRLLTLVPNHLSPKVTRRLQHELLKPFSDKDEPGYIYIFWLTDSPISPSPSGSNTPSASPSKPSTPSAAKPTSTDYLRPSPQQPRTHSSSLMRTAAAAEGTHTPGGGSPTILLKIGRANNVQRRLSEWQSQCGYNLSLIRYYPHTSATSPAPTPNDAIGRMVPNVHRVERLIHLELADRNPKQQCKACGKMHQEWFEIEASRRGVEGVNETVKRWSDYAERSAAGLPVGAGYGPGKMSRLAVGGSRPSSRPSNRPVSGNSRPSSSSNAATAGSPDATPKAKTKAPKAPGDKEKAKKSGVTEADRPKPPPRSNAAKTPGDVKMQADKTNNGSGSNSSPAAKKKTASPDKPAKAPAAGDKKGEPKKGDASAKQKKKPAAAAAQKKKKPGLKKPNPKKHAADIDSEDSDWSEQDYEPSD